MLDFKAFNILHPDGTVEKSQPSSLLDTEQLLSLYRLMLLNRRLDERMIMLQRQGRIGFYVGSVGEEAAIIGSAYALDEKDWIVPCYRELGAALVRGFSLFELMCQFFGNSEDLIKGRQMPNHYGRRDLRYLSVSSPVGTQIPQATGISLAIKIRGGSEVVLVYFGDGATSQGDFHVAMNFAGVYKTPTIFFCRNNQWAISTPASCQTASESLAAKGQAYGIPGVQVDGNDLIAVHAVTAEAVRKARRGEGPTLIEAVTYRLGGHSTSDDPKAYRDENQVEPWRRQDPLIRLRSHLIAGGHWTESEDSALEEEIREQIQENLKRAESLPPPAVDTLFDDVYDRIPWHLAEQREELKKVDE
ncbi:MAG TPA: pyruvate dehydrogenase (acetyl-transferring) E1 component subunit alpha [Acidobacteriota bacterium]|nr:pyruvate dehydrogenase (acetyl-transferring) E1 component subunit alpha [Acidobacteriota bacterium]